MKNYLKYFPLKFYCKSLLHKRTNFYSLINKNKSTFNDQGQEINMKQETIDEMIDSHQGQYKSTQNSQSYSQGYGSNNYQTSKKRNKISFLRDGMMMTIYLKRVRIIFNNN